MSNGYDKLIKKYQDYRRDLPEILEERILDQTAAELEKKYKKRIFINGLDSNGDEISDGYSTKPTTVTQKVFIKPSAFKGKKTMKLEHGYKELRDIQGLKTDSVNLDYSGDLKRSIRIARSQKSVVIGIMDKNNFYKAQNLEKKYKTKIFQFSQVEIRDHFKSVVKNLRKIQKEYFYGK